MDINKIIDEKSRDDLYLVQFPEIVLVVAPVSFQRAKAYKVLADSNPKIIADIEDAFFQECKVDSEPDIQSQEMFDQLKAGIVTTVFKLGLMISLPPQDSGQINKQFQDAQNLTKNSTETQLILLICKAFGYKPEELENWTWEKLVKRATEADFILNPPSPEPSGEHVVTNKKIKRF